jgi:hypothetical protein
MAAGAMNVTEQCTPTLIRFIDTKELATILGACIGDSRSHILQAPKLTTFSDQPGYLCDTTDRAYGWSNSKDHANIEVFQEGMTVKCHPEVLEDGSIRMKELHAGFSRIIGQERYALDPNGETVLEVPKLQTRKFNLPVTIPAGKTLLVALPQPFGGVETEAPKGKRNRVDTLCLAVTCYVLTPEMIAESKSKVTKAKQEMYDSENMSQAELEWKRMWMTDKPSSLTQSRLTGELR